MERTHKVLLILRRAGGRIACRGDLQAVWLLYKHRDSEFQSHGDPLSAFTSLMGHRKLTSQEQGLTPPVIAKIIAQPRMLLLFETIFSFEKLQIYNFT